MFRLFWLISLKTFWSWSPCSFPLTIAHHSRRFLKIRPKARAAKVSLRCSLGLYPPPGTSPNLLLEQLQNTPCGIASPVPKDWSSLERLHASYLPPANSNTYVLELPLFELRHVTRMVVPSRRYDKMRQSICVASAIELSLRHECPAMSPTEQRKHSQSQCQSQRTPNPRAGIAVDQSPCE